MDAAHVVVAPFWGIVWCWQRVLVKAPAGRQRVTVLAALKAMTQELCTVEQLTSMTAETVCEWWHRLAGAHQGIPITIILDNARDQRCAVVQAVAQEWGMELLYLPAYSPNLNLLERFWRCVKQPCLYSKYDADRTSFQQAILTWIQQAPTTHNEELEQFLTWRFQTFQDVPVIGDQQTVSKRSKKKVLSKAA
jgi:transposase